MFGSLLFGEGKALRRGPFLSNDLCLALELDLGDRGRWLVKEGGRLGDLLCGVAEMAGLAGGLTPVGVT